MKYRGIQKTVDVKIGAVKSKPARHSWGAHFCGMLAGALIAGDAFAISNSVAAMQQYCDVPIFVQGGVKVRPNITILMDNSASMMREAYVASSPVYDNKQQYIGLFNSEWCYEYSSAGQYFYHWYYVKQPPSWGYQPADYDFSCWDWWGNQGRFSGNFLNFLAMSRFEVAKAVLTGGRWNSATQMLEGETTVMHPDGPSSWTINVDPYNYTNYPHCADIDYKRGTHTTPADTFTITGNDCGAAAGGSPPGPYPFDQTKFLSSTNINNDSDMDGLKNNVDKASNNCITNNPDTDGDGWLDGFEWDRGWGCNSPGVPDMTDTDGDGLIDALEGPGKMFPDCNPNMWDTDGDGFSDGHEIDAGTKCNDPTSKPGSGGGGSVTNTYKIRISHWNEPQGVLHSFDENDARWALASFNNTDMKDGSKIVVPYGASLDNILIPALRKLVGPAVQSNIDDTPLSDAFYEIVRWHAQLPPYWHGTPLAASIATQAQRLAPLTFWPTPDYIVNSPVPLGDPSTFTGSDVIEWDPWFEWEQYNGAPQQYVECRKSNVLVISDGKTSREDNITHNGVSLGNFDGDEHVGIQGAVGGEHYSPSHAYPEKIQWPPANHEHWADPKLQTGSGSDYLDDMALWANIGGGTVGVPGVAGGGVVGDFRGGTWAPLLGGNQTVQSYYVYAFGDTSGTSSESNESGQPWTMWNAAINGAFVDRNGNNLPDLISEWDSNGDGDPDGFFNAEDGAELETAIVSAINAILNRSATGAAASIAVNSSEGEAGVVQTFFDPRLLLDGNTIASWVGQLRLLWADRFTLIREDRTPPNINEGDQTLTLDVDRPVVYQYDAAANQTFAYYYTDLNKDGVIDQDTDLSTPGIEGSPVHISPLRDVPAMADAGLGLFKKRYWERTIYSHSRSHKDVPTNPMVDLYCGNGCPNGNWAYWNFVQSTDLNGDSINDYTQLPQGTWESFDLFWYTMGQDGWLVNNCPIGSGWGLYNWRCRTMEVGGLTNTWKLADIVYSTPAIVGVPASREMDYVFPASYPKYRAKHLERAQTLYVGSNGGMLHAFHVGIFRNGDDENRIDGNPTSEIDDAYMDPAPHGYYGGYYGPGEEMWAFIPYNAWPHLQWTRLPEYEDCHIYYVDLSPSAIDAQVYDKNLPDSDDRANGWSTLIAGGTRTGCRKAASEGDFGPFSDSAYTTEPFGPAYFIMDITVPHNPRLIWEWTAPKDTMATVTPQIFRVVHKDTSNCTFSEALVTPDLPLCEDAWFVAYGTGPQNPDFSSAMDENEVYVVRLDTGPFRGGPSFYDASNMQVFTFEKPAGSLGEYISDIAAVHDLDAATLDYDGSVGTLYILTTVLNPGGDYDGRIMRLHTGDQLPPSTWELSEAFRSDTPFSALLRVRSVINQGDEGNTQRIRTTLMIGTGRYYSPADRDYNEQNYMMLLRDDCSYGKDEAGCKCGAGSVCDANNWESWDLSNMLNTTGCDLKTMGGCEDGAAEALGPIAIRGLLSEPNDNYKGWYYKVDVPPTVEKAERVVSRALIQGSTLAFTTFVPGDSGPCGAVDPGYSNLYFFDMGSGFAYGITPLGAGIASGAELGGKIVVASSQGQIQVEENPNVVVPLPGFKEIRKLVNSK